LEKLGTPSGYCQNLAKLKLGMPFELLAKAGKKKTHPFLLLAKHVKTKIKPSGYWQNLVCLPNMSKTKTTPSHFRENLAEPKHAFWVLVKPSKTKTCMPSRCWQNQNLPHLPNIGKTSQNQNLAHLSTICKTQRNQNLVCLSGCGKTWQNQNHPFPVLSKPGKTFTFSGLAKPGNQSLAHLSSIG
jgi:hypothetical protein